MCRNVNPGWHFTSFYMEIVNLAIVRSTRLSKRVTQQKGLTRVETFLECKLTEEGSPVTVIHPGLENGFQTVVSAVSQRESIQLYLSLTKLKSRINRSADLKAEQIRLKKGLNERKSLHTYCKCAA